MAAFIETIKAVVTRVVFSLHGLLAIWKVVNDTNDPFFWYLSSTILVLAFEGIFTLLIKETQDWKWYYSKVKLVCSTNLQDEIVCLILIL